jgi:hypothetical protein
MSSHNAMNPNGGAIMRRVIEQPDLSVNSSVFVRHVLLVSVKELMGKHSLPGYGPVVL